MSSKYIVRLPIKDRDNHIIGYEIQYYGENSAFGGGDSAAANDFAAGHHLQFSYSQYGQAAAGDAELHDLHHHAAHEKVAPPV